MWYLFYYQIKNVHCWYFIRENMKYVIWGFNIFDVCEICIHSNSQTGNEFQEWRPAEAILFCIWAISNYVSVVEAEVMPVVMPKVCVMDSFSMCMFIYRAAAILFFCHWGIWVSHLVFFNAGIGVWVFAPSNLCI